MDEGYMSWRMLARRQWPLAVVLAGLLAAQMAAWRGLSLSQWWQLPGDVIVCALAVVALRHAFRTAAIGAAVMVAAAALMWVLKVERTTSDVIQLAAGMALVAIVVRLAPRGRAATGAALVILGYAFSSAVRWDPADHTPTNSASVLFWLLTFGIAIGTGLYFRARDAERRRAEQSSVAAAQQAERLALARELHDVVAHYVTGIVVHSQGAQAIAEQNPDAARMVLPIITTSGHEALAAMRRLVGTLRGTEPTPTSRDNNELTAQIRKLADHPVQLKIDLTEQVPPELAQSVLRLVQESVTNARKHAAGVTRIDVEVRTTTEAIQVQVTDNGTGQQTNPAGGSGGFGLVGMRERVELLGGNFNAGRNPTKGWTVTAELPLRD